ncbi:MAG: alpha/beta hydrolase family esterase [Bosea sp. (in: a-proteobacteria)]
MKTVVMFLFLLLGSTASAFADAAVPCAISPGCNVAGGRYLALAPEAWDGKTPLPVLIFYHGWRESAEYVVSEPLLRAFAHDNKVLLIAPHGMGNTWSYPGSPGKHRDEFAFAEALVADVKTRFATDPAYFVAAGFSQGASMVWNIACARPALFSAYGALAGGFWEPSPPSCTGAGVNLIHIHGTNDATVPMSGRALRGGVYRQADVRRDWALWLSENGCKAEPDTSTEISGRTCRQWSGCAKPRALSFCTHDGGHSIHAGDLAALWQVVMRK